MQRFFLIFLIPFCIYTPAFSDVTFEGANNEIAILAGFIETEELDEMLAEIKMKKPKQIILDSYGGDTQSARYLARYIHDNNISTYVSKVAVCKSACVILFLAGKKRLCEGELGVHQGYLPKDEENEKIKIKYALESIQKFIGEEIELLNSFNTPPFVYPYMLKNTEIYNFSKEEIARINTVKSLDEM
ncbi:hypothetical protein N8Z71_03765 [Amylibacter sp.]|nr:hypothetical protein [Amylibacter sp.]